MANPTIHVTTNLHEALSKNLFDPKEISPAQLIDVLNSFEHLIDHWSVHFTSLERKCCYDCTFNPLSTSYNWKDTPSNCFVRHAHCLICSTIQYWKECHTVQLLEFQDQCEDHLLSHLQSRQYMRFTIWNVFLVSAVPSVIESQLQKHAQNYLETIRDCLEDGSEVLRNAWLEILVWLACYPACSLALKSSEALVAWLRQRATTGASMRFTSVMATNILLKLNQPMDPKPLIAHFEAQSSCTEPSISLPLLEHYLDTLTLFAHQTTGLIQLSEQPSDMWRSLAQRYLHPAMKMKATNALLHSSLITLTYHLTCCTPPKSSTVSEELLQLQQQCHDQLCERLLEGQWFALLSQSRPKSKLLMDYLSETAYTLMQSPSNCAKMVHQGVLTWLPSLTSMRANEAMALLTIYLDPALTFPGKMVDQVFPGMLLLIQSKKEDDAAFERKSQGYMALTNLASQLNEPQLIELKKWILKDLFHPHSMVKQRAWECLGNMLNRITPEFIFSSDNVTWQKWGIRCLKNTSESDGMKRAVATALAFSASLLTSETLSQMEDILSKTNNKEIGHRLLFAFSTISSNHFNKLQIAKNAESKFGNQGEVGKIIQMLLESEEKH